MKTYAAGDSVCFKSHEGDKMRWGTVMFRLGRGDDYYGYEIQEDGDEGLIHTVMNDRVVDLEDISRQAGAALDRIHAEDRRQAGLLHELLGALIFYANHGGEIAYQSGSNRWDYAPVSKILNEFKAKADNRIPITTEPMEPGDRV